MFSLLSLSAVAVAQDFPPLLLKHVFPEALPLLLMGPALPSSGSVLEPAGISSIAQGESFQQLLAEAAPVAPC